MTYESLRLAFYKLVALVVYLFPVVLVLWAVTVALIENFGSITWFQSAQREMVLQVLTESIGPLGMTLGIHLVLLVLVTVTWGIFFFPFLSRWPRKFLVALLAVGAFNLSLLFPDTLSRFGLKPLDVVGTTVGVSILLLVWSLIRFTLIRIYRRVTGGGNQGARLDIIAKTASLLALILFGVTTVTVYFLGGSEYLLPGILLMVFLMLISVVAANSRGLTVDSFGSLRTKIVFIFLLVLVLYLVFHEGGLLGNVATVFVVLLLLYVVRVGTNTGGQAVVPAISNQSIQSGARTMTKRSTGPFSFDKAIISALYALTWQRIAFVVFAVILMFLWGIWLEPNSGVWVVLVTMFYIAPHIAWTALAAENTNPRFTNKALPFVVVVQLIAATAYAMLVYSFSPTITNFIVSLGVWSALVILEPVIHVLRENFDLKVGFESLKSNPRAGMVAIWSSLLFVIGSVMLVVAYLVFLRLDQHLYLLVVLAVVLGSLAIVIVVVFWHQIILELNGWKIQKSIAAANRNGQAVPKKIAVEAGSQFTWSAAVDGKTELTVMGTSFQCGTVVIELRDGLVHLFIQDPNGTLANGRRPVHSSHQIRHPGSLSQGEEWHNGDRHDFVTGSLKVTVEMVSVSYPDNSPVIKDASMRVVVLDTE